MNRGQRCVTLLTMFLSLPVQCVLADTRPNIILLMADDQGWGNRPSAAAMLPLKAQ